MPSVKRAGTPKGAGRSPKPKAAPLPAVTVAKLEETGRLLEHVVSTNAELFVEKGEQFKQLHQEGASRPLTPMESAHIARELAGDDMIEKAQEVQKTLRVYEQPDAREILLAAGIGVAPAFVDAVCRAVALIEMPNATFEQACDEGTLGETIEEAAVELRKLALQDGRERASRAFAHYAEAAGFDPGEAWSLPAKAVWQAIKDAMTVLTADSASSRLIDSAESTAGADETSSTDSPGEKPSS